METLRDQLKIPRERLDEINAFLSDPNNELVNQLLEVVEYYGGPGKINRKAEEAGSFDNLMERLRGMDSPYVKDIEWFVEQRDQYAFVSMHVIGATYVETLDTRGTDGSNIHLGGPETIAGYFGGVGQPNEHPIKWLDEYLYFYTHYGVRQVLNINPGTVLAGYLLYKLGIDNQFKISVFMGNDNPFSVLWTLLTARLFSRPDGSTSLIGFNLSN